MRSDPRPHLGEPNFLVLVVGCQPLGVCHDGTLPGTCFGDTPAYVDELLLDAQ